MPGNNPNPHQTGNNNSIKKDNTDQSANLSTPSGVNFRHQSEETRMFFRVNFYMLMDDLEDALMAGGVDNITNPKHPIAKKNAAAVLQLYLRGASDSTANNPPPQVTPTQILVRRDELIELSRRGNSEDRPSYVASSEKLMNLAAELVIKGLPDSAIPRTVFSRPILSLQLDFTNEALGVGLSYIDHPQHPIKTRGAAGVLQLNVLYNYPDSEVVRRRDELVTYFRNAYRDSHPDKISAATDLLNLACAELINQNHNQP